MDRELKRGTLELVLLRVLADGELYGYEMVAAIRSRSRGELLVKDGTLYPILYRLEEAGFVAPRWETPKRGVPRKYYSLTTSGREQLNSLITEWQAFADGLAHLLAPTRDDQ